MAGKRYWKIAGYDGEKQTFEKILPAGSLSESQVILLLQRLAAKHLAACRTEVRENGCGRIAMWRGHGIERLS